MPRPKKVKPPQAVYQLKISLDKIRPPIWRRVLVAGNCSLARLHGIIQTIMPWDGGHLHVFEHAGVEYGPTSGDSQVERARSEARAWLDDLKLVEGSRFRYWYDFGDSWYHTILVEKMLPLSAVADQAALPLVLAGKRACPPDDCGGPWGYAEMLEVLADPKHPDHDHWSEWIGDDFDPEEFDLEAANEALSRLRK